MSRPVHELSRAECQEELLKLRDSMLQACEKLSSTSAAYYYLCDVVGKAPPNLDESLSPIVANQAAVYVASWQDLILVAQRASSVLDRLTSSSEIEKQLAELENEDGGP